MKENRKKGIEALLKAYSVVSDKENSLLSDVLMKADVEETPYDRERVDQFLNRFSNEKPFSEIVLEAIRCAGATKEDVAQDIHLSEDVLEKVLTNKALPNIIPLKKMISLLKLIRIPIDRAVDSLRVSLNRFDPHQSIEMVTGAAMRQNRGMAGAIGAGGKSRVSLKRGLEAYIKRLQQEDV